MNQQSFAVILPLVAFFILDLILSLSSIRQEKLSSKKMPFTRVSFFVTLCQGFTVCTYACDFGIVHISSGLQFFLNAAALSAMTLAAFVWYDYLLLISHGDEYQKKKMLMNLAAIPAILMIAFIDVSPWTHWVFYIDENGVYRTGTLFFLQFIPFLYFFMGFLSLFLAMKERSSSAKAFKRFSLFFVPAIVGSFLNVKVYRGGYTQIGCSIGAFLLYLEQFVEEVGEAKRLQSVEELNGQLQESLRQQAVQLSIVKTLSQNYLNVYFINPEKDVVTILKLDGYVTEGLSRKGSSSYPYGPTYRKYIEGRVFQDDKAMMMEVMDLGNIEKQLAEKKEYTGTYRVFDKGEIHYYQYTYARIAESGEIIAGFQNVDAMIAGEKEQQDRLQKALEDAKKANAAKSAFLARMSHDIRTPLNGIIGLIEIDDKHPENYETVQENRGKAKVAANHLLSLISDVLEISKLEDTNIHLVKEPIDLRQLAKDVLTIIGMRCIEEGITLEYGDVETDYAEPYVWGSSLHVRQICLNILGNAVKYNRPGGSIRASSELISSDDTHVTYLTIISDTGIGMSEEFLKHLYEPFSQEHNDARSRYQGTGLGMSIVKSLVDLMGGTIEVESTPGKGTTFRITMTFEKASPENFPKPSVLEEMTFEDKHALIVEDNDLNMLIARSIAEDLGLHVTEAHDGKEAVELFSSHDKGTFQVILMDLMMPVMDGFEATRAIRSLEREDAKTIPIIALTANAFQEDAQKCRDAGMNGHLAKPIEIPKLKEVLASVLA